MTKAWLEQLKGWHDFYVIVGSVAAGLTGLIVTGANAKVGLATLGGTVILLLVIEIRNAWDMALWMAQQTKH